MFIYACERARENAYVCVWVCERVHVYMYVQADTANIMSIYSTATNSSIVSSK